MFWRDELEDSQRLRINELKKSWFLSSRRKKNILEEVVDWFFLMSNGIDANSTYARMYDENILFTEAKCLIDKKVLAIIIKQLVEFHNSHQFILGRILFIFEWIQRVRSNEASACDCMDTCMHGNQVEILCETSVVLFSTDDVKELVRLWSTCSDQEVLNNFASFFVSISLFGGFDNVLADLLYDYNPITSPADARRYLPLLTQEECTFSHHYHIDVKISRMSKVMSTVIKSVTYLVNCWRMLHETDSVAEIQWIEKELRKLLVVISSWGEKIEMRSDMFFSSELLEAGIGRLLRCVVFALVETPSRSNKKLWKFFHDHVTSMLDINTTILQNYFALLSPSEMKDYIDQIDGKTEQRYAIGKRSQFTSSTMKTALKRMLSYENQLKPLSPSDLDILVAPSHVKDAINSLSEADLHYEPQLGCWSLLQAYQHRILFVSWTRAVLDAFQDCHQYVHFAKTIAKTGYRGYRPLLVLD